jgi:hypothetical protein
MTEFTSDGNFVYVFIEQNIYDNNNRGRTQYRSNNTHPESKSWISLPGEMLLYKNTCNDTDLPD